jgi:predicted ATPase
MIKSLEINNFKCFRNLRLQGCSRFNLLTGQSGSGKTAFMEALFLACGGSIELYFRTRRWRGYSENVEVMGGELYETIWRDLVSLQLDTDASQAHEATIRLHDSGSGQRNLRIAKTGKQGILFDPGNDASGRPVHFFWRVDKRLYESKVEIGKDGLKVSGNGPALKVIMLTPMSLYQRENVKRFSALSRRRAHTPLVEGIRKVFPQIDDMSIEMDLGQTTLYATVRGLAEKIALPAISAGLSKYISIALAIISQPRGVVLIDEIENGFHHSSLVPLLTSINLLAKEHDVQIFASTHSEEFLRAIADVLAEDLSSLTLMHAKWEGSESSIALVDGERAVDAVKFSEVR